MGGEGGLVVGFVLGGGWGGGLTGFGEVVFILGRDVEGYGDAVGCFGNIWKAGVRICGGGRRGALVGWLLGGRGRRGVSSHVISSGKMESRTSRSSICSSRPMFP